MREPESAHVRGELTGPELWAASLQDRFSPIVAQWIAHARSKGPCDISFIFGIEDGAIMPGLSWTVSANHGLGSAEIGTIRRGGNLDALRGAEMDLASLLFGVPVRRALAATMFGARGLRQGKHWLQGRALGRYPAEAIERYAVSAPPDWLALAEATQAPREFIARVDWALCSADAQYPPAVTPAKPPRL